MSRRSPPRRARRRRRPPALGTHARSARALHRLAGREASADRAARSLPLVARAHAAALRTARDRRSPAPAPAHAGRAGPAAGRGRAQPVACRPRLTVTATGYSLGGTTATGLPVGWGVAAVDPSVIPLGTHMTVPGYGEAVAADTGGAVVGATIDLWFPTVAQANAWGRRTVTIVLH